VATLLPVPAASTAVVNGNKLANANCLYLLMSDKDRQEQQRHF
jgi:hypothetical protein